MELRRTHWIAAFRLAAVVSAVAVAIALALNAFGDVSQTAVVIGVIVVGFVVSWVQSGRSPRDRAEVPGRLDSGRSSTRTMVGHGHIGDGDHASHRVATVRLHP